MGNRTPNMSIYIPATNETLYGDSFATGMVNVDQHDHSGPPNKGVPISSSGIAPNSITKDKLNPNVVSPGEGLAIDGANPNALKADGALNSLYKLSTNGVLCETSPTTVMARTLTGTRNEIVIANGTGVAGNPTFSMDPSFRKLVQYVKTQDSTGADIGTDILNDNHTPINTDGTEVLSLVITPVYTNSIIEINCNVQASTTGVPLPVLSLFRNGVTNALASVMQQGLNFSISFKFFYTVSVAGTITFSVRMGRSASAGTVYYNKYGATNNFGGTLFSTLEAYELKV